MQKHLVCGFFTIAVEESLYCPLYRIILLLKRSIFLPSPIFQLNYQILFCRLFKLCSAEEIYEGINSLMPIVCTRFPPSLCSALNHLNIQMVLRLAGALRQSLTKHHQARQPADAAEGCQHKQIRSVTRIISNNLRPKSSCSQFS